LAGFAGVSLIYFLMAGLIKWKGMQLLDRLFPPVVIGPVIMLIGLSLSGTAVDMAKTDWLLALVALAVSIIVMMFGKGLLKLLPVISGIIAGFLVAICLGKVDFSAVADASWFALPQNIRHPQLPAFQWEPFIFMMPVALAAVVEHVGDVYAISAVADKDFVKNPGLHRTMLGDGLACLAAALMGGPPVTTYSEVTGAVQITRITNPQVIRIAAVTAILFSIVGKLNAILQAIPQAVLGGIMLLLFGSIAAVGVQNLMRNHVDFGVTRNIIIASIILTTGIGGAVLTAGSFSLSGIGLAALIGLVLNLILPKEKKA